MYQNEKTPHAVEKVLRTFFIVFLIVMLGILGFAIIDHIDGDTMTVTSGDEDNEDCGDAQAQKAMQRAGVKVPVRCKKK